MSLAFLLLRLSLFTFLNNARIYIYIYMNYAEGLHFSAFHYNRKGFYSVVLQAVVSYNYLFTDLNIAWPGSVHDARVLAITLLFVLIMICFKEIFCLWEVTQQ